MASQFVASFALLIAMASLMASATDPNQLEDFCVAPKDISSAVLVQGQLCKNPADVTAEDFTFRGLNGPAQILDPVGTGITRALMPGLNTLGISLSRVTYVASGGLAPPHIHPRATEVMTILEGSIYAGFVRFNESNNSARVFATVLYPGDVFVCPQNLIHFAINTEDKPAGVLVAFSSQNPGLHSVPQSTFATKPPISVDLLSKAFKLDPEIIDVKSRCVI